ncbi:MAG: tyrosine-protein phosphatase [Anaerolineales bacterium]|nr:tyrosine-protein phosphatase [Anaerolineales bacterium]
MNDRILLWDACTNVRDLGDLHTSTGHTTRYHSIVRSDTPARLTAAGWAALHAYGIRTIITLHTHGMQEPELAFTAPYPDLVTLQVAIEDVTDKDFVQQWASTELWSTPLYYSDALRRWPGRHAAAISAIARAQPGGVLFHCARGHDRTGIIALLLLTLAGVTPQDILADYELSLDPERDALLTRQGTSVRQVLLGALDGLDVEDYLLLGGASREDLAAVRQRLLG